MSRTLWAVVVAAGLAMTSGCGGSPPGAPIGEGKAALEDLGQMLKDLASENRKPPAKLAELEAVEPMIPVAGPAVRSGEVVYLWGTPYAAGGTQVAAHEKKVPTEGGFVLLQDGTVKEMTASEFQAAAPKAKR